MNYFLIIFIQLIESYQPYFLYRGNGFPDSISTYGVVSGMWTSMLSLGAFMGPSVGGVRSIIFGKCLAALELHFWLVAKRVFPFRFFWIMLDSDLEAYLYWPLQLFW